MQSKRTALGLVLGLAVAVSSAAQDEADYRFAEVLDVRLVNVEVWVTDDRGVPVSGLVAADFELLEDGQPVAITHFAEVQQGRPVASELDSALTARQLPEPAPRTPTVEPGHLVLYFDQLHLHAASRNRLIEDLRDFLVARNVAPERVLVLSQDQDLTTEASFGSSWSELDDALARVAETAPLGGRTESEKRLAVRDLQELWRQARELAASNPRATGSSEEAACGYFMSRAVPDVQTRIRESNQRIALTLGHLTSVASFLTGVPGVKTLLFLSDALERSPGADLAAFIQKLCPSQQDSRLLTLSDELGREFTRLTRHANANRVTIYALQARGLRPSFMAGAEQAAMDFRAATAFETALDQVERGGLSILAEDTGGRAVFNRNDFDAELGEIGREMSSYYSLAYDPPHGGDAGEHSIEIRLRSPGLRARHRSAYLAKDRDTQMAERLQGAVYLGLVDNPLGVRLGAGTVRAGSDKLLQLPLHVLVPADRLAFLPEGDDVVARLSVQLSTRNTRNLKGLFEHTAFRVRRPADGPQEPVGLVLQLQLPAGVHLVAVALRDDATFETSFVTTTVELQGG